jgi:transposase
MKKTRRQYDDEFKKLAVDLASAKGSVKSTAEELGIAADILARWRRELGPASSTARSDVSPEQQEIIRLKRELKEAQLERDILKKAVGIFSRSDGKYFDS